jgi:tRNA G10  N-methylase Trm11
MFELSKEQNTLPCAEILACLDAENTPYAVIDSNEDVLLVEVKTNASLIRNLTKRLAFTFLIDELLYICPATIHDIV